MDLSWTDNSGNETGFEVWRSTTGASGTFALEATVGADVKSFGNTGLQDNAEYCYRVRATGSGGLDSPFTATACATTPTPQAPPPAAPSNLAAVPTSPTVIALSWIDNASDETGFEIWRSTTGATGTYSLLSNVVANVTNANDSGLDPVVPYCYEVRAVGAVNAPPSDFTTASCATTPAPPAPNTPSNVSATATSTTDITVTWRDNSSDETGFEIWRSTTGASGTYSFLVSVAANAESTNDTGLTPGTQYCYKVKALGGGVTPSSPLSGSDCATTGAQVAAPSSLAATVTSSTAIALTWTDNSSNESGFEIWRSTTGASGTYTLRNTVAANAESTNDTGLTPGTQYCYEVRGLGNGINPASDFSSSGCATPITVRVVLFGDSNTDRCPDQSSVPGSYVSVVPRLGPTNPHPSCTVAGKVQAKWEAIRSKTIVVVNHGINSTTTGGNTHLTGDPDRTSQGSPNARFSVGGKDALRGGGPGGRVSLVRRRADQQVLPYRPPHARKCLHAGRERLRVCLDGDQRRRGAHANVDRGPDRGQPPLDGRAMDRRRPGAQSLHHHHPGTTGQCELIDLDPRSEHPHPYAGVRPRPSPDRSVEPRL